VWATCEQATFKEQVTISARGKPVAPIYFTSTQSYGAAGLTLGFDLDANGDGMLDAAEMAAADVAIAKAAKDLRDPTTNFKLMTTHPEDMGTSMYATSNSS
jgi:hypothetical protein